MSPTFLTIAEAPRSRIERHGFDRYLFFGKADELIDGPQAYINELDPGVELAAHFHKVDQFQVFFGVAGARFLRHPIPKVMVHYTDAYSTYGPFASGTEGRLLYATLRAEHSNFGGVMPGARPELPYRGRRNLEADVEDWKTDNGPERGVVHRQVIARAADGMACTLTIASPGLAFSVDRGRPISGRFYCVLDGQVVGPAEKFRRLSLGWEGSDERPGTLVAGPRGCSLLTLDFPYPPSPAQHAAEEQLPKNS